MGFKVGDVIVISDGRNEHITKIDGIKKGHIRVGFLLFDWCGNEVDSVAPTHRIYPFNKDDREEDR